MKRNNEYFAINEFTGGINTDFDESRILRNQMRSLRNGRFLSLNGEDGVITDLNGNSSKFSITAGFIPLASKTYKGVSYILSWNALTSTGEIGCYPSPLAYSTPNAALTGFSQVYSPLWNFTGASNDQHSGAPTRGFFSSTLLKFNPDKQPRIVLREDYDKTVNIYFADGENIDRIINSGFNCESGAVVNKRCYGNNSFPNFVHVLNESVYHPNINTIDMLHGGKLKAGNWKLFFRYTSNDYNPTSFLAETNMLMAVDYDLVSTISSQGNASSHVTNKLIKVGLNNLDPAYKYIEVGYCYYFDDVFQTGIINKRFEIDYATNTCDIVFTGYEDSFEVDPSEIFTKKSKHKISETISDLDQRLFRANTKLAYSHNDELQTFANKLVPHHDVSYSMNTSEFYGNLPISTNGAYKNWQHVYFRTGYFSGESYPFGVVFVFEDGSESDVYPTEGIDLWNPAATVTNNKGVVRFPEPRLRPIGTFNSVGTHGLVYQSGVSDIMGIVFDQSAAWTYLNALPGSSYLKTKVVGFYYVRSERKKNLLYQGFSLPVYTTDDSSTNYQNFLSGVLTLFNLTTFASNVDRIVNRSAVFAPFLVKDYVLNPQAMVTVNGDMSSMFGLGGTSQLNLYTASNESGADIFLKEFQGKKGFFSADYFFKQSLPNTDYYIHPIHKILTSFDTVASPADYDINQLYFYLKNTTTPALITSHKVKASRITDWQKIPLNGFVSYFDEGSPSSISSLFFSSLTSSTLLNSNKKSLAIKSLAMGIGRYIGLDFVDSETDAAADYYKLTLSNLYISDPATIAIGNTIDVKNTNYFKISGLKKIALASQTANSGILYNGDCFLQRFSQKVSFNPNVYPVGKRDDNFSLTVALFLNLTVNRREYITWGQYFEWVSENEINVGMRMVDGTKSFWPSNAPNIEDFAAKNVLPESDKINKGYSATTSIMTYSGYNSDLPVHLAEFPTRIHGSSNHVLNAFKDGYRNFPLAAYRDYDFGHGRIIDIQTLMGQLICVSEKHIGVVPVNEKVTIGSSSGELAIGFGDLLPVKQADMSQQVGSQQKMSIINTGYFVYGVDFWMRKIWRVSSNTALEYLSDTHHVSSDLNTLINSVTSYSDITVPPSNKPLSGQGISVGYDFKYGDVYMTFVFGSVKETFVFNEKSNVFAFFSDVFSPFYMTINEDFYSVNPAALKDFYLHDDTLNKLTFYGAIKPMKLTFIVNEKADVSKIFSNIYIQSNGEEFDIIEYETLGQTASQNPFIRNLVVNPLEVWMQPKYKEDRWVLPIKRADVSKVIANNNFAIKSKMTGQWLKIILTFSKNKSIFIKSIITEYLISNR